MKTYFDLYGFKQSDLELVRAELEMVLELKFVAHDSLYRGGLYYRCDRPHSESFQLVGNFNHIEQEYAEEQFADYPTLLYVEQASSPKVTEETIVNNMSSAKLLRREIL
ncbi:MAG: hypothetical protein H6641_07545 [Caldilineaceae bacterium]|nr:hypothetical protein [Caldilineaceae bacterium]